MIKRYANLALIYAVVAMVFGVFYREFTKFNDFSGQTRLSVLHTHYFMLGMFFFLIVYQVGLHLTGLGFLLRGMKQVRGEEISKGMDASISGIAGIGHILTGVCIVLLLLNVRKMAA